jgi:hypothetical protein
MCETVYWVRRKKFETPGLLEYEVEITVHFTPRSEFCIAPYKLRVLSVVYEYIRGSWDVFMFERFLRP